MQSAQLLGKYGEQPLFLVGGSPSNTGADGSSSEAGYGGYPLGQMLRMPDGTLLRERKNTQTTCRPPHPTPPACRLPSPPKPRPVLTLPPCAGSQRSAARASCSTSLRATCR